MKYQHELRMVLLVVTLMMTAMFGFSLADGFSGFLFAVTLVALQAGALLFVPAKATVAFKSEQIFPGLLYSASIILVLMTSVTASVATLSASEDHALAQQKQRQTLQNAVDGYMDRGFITKGLAVKSELDALPEAKPTGLQSAAVRIGEVTGWNGSTIISWFVVIVALLLDGFVIILAPATGEASVKTQVIEKDITPDQEEPQAPEEVGKVLEALEKGDIERLSVRQVRSFLNCGQTKATQVANICKQLQLQLVER